MPDHPDDAEPHHETDGAVAADEARPRRIRRLLADRATRRTIEWVALVVLALGVAFLLRTFVVQSFYIPSESMTPTLQVGDRVLVNKLAYRFGEPSRGDIVVFEAPPGEGNPEIKDLIKRVVALPGETVEGRGGEIFVDGERLRESWLSNGARSRNFGPERVPEDHYWVLGDNRLDSRDSTFFKSIPEDTLIGKAFVRIWPLSDFSTL